MRRAAVPLMDFPWWFRACVPPAAPLARRAPWAAPALVALLVLLPAPQPTGALQLAGPDHRLMVLLVDFPDTPHTVEMEVVRRRVFEEVNAYYLEASYGKARWVGEVSGWIRMPRPSGEYGLEGARPGRSRVRLVEEAVRAADATVDFRGYEAVLLVTSRGARIGCCFAVGREGGGSSLTVSTDDGATIRRAAVVRETTSWGAVAHELGHVLGLPDLYASHLADVFPPVLAAIYMGCWDLMSRGPGSGAERPHPSAWSKIKLGWLTPPKVVTITPGQAVTLALIPLAAQTEGVQAVRIPLEGDRRYYLVEARWKIGYDRVLPTEGVLVTLVDEVVPGGRGGVRVVNAHPDASDPEMIRRFCPLYGAAFSADPARNRRFEDGARNVAVEVRTRTSTGYVVEIGPVR